MDEMRRKRIDRAVHDTEEAMWKMEDAIEVIKRMQTLEEDRGPDPYEDAVRCLDRLRQMRDLRLGILRDNPITEVTA